MVDGIASKGYARGRVIELDWRRCDVVVASRCGVIANFVALAFGMRAKKTRVTFAACFSAVESASLAAFSGEAENEIPFGGGDRSDGQTVAASQDHELAQLAAGVLS